MSRAKEQTCPQYIYIIFSPPFYLAFICLTAAVVNPVLQWWLLLPPSVTVTSTCVFVGLFNLTVPIGSAEP